MKKVLCCILAATMLATALVGCNNSGNSASAGGTDSTPAPAKKVVFWYNHKGDEAKVFDDVIKMYNDSQSKYAVEGMSVTDKQKVIVALASSESPDAIEGSNQDVIAYQASSLIENISDWVKKDNYDTSVYAKQNLDANTVNGSLYGLPFNSIIIQMFYNKDILKEIGYTEPPKTMEELYEMAEKATTLDADGNIDRLGYPLFPLASARQELIYAFGGRWWAPDGKTLTPTAQGNIDSLNMNIKFREKYGVDKVQAFVATANTNRYTEKDMFFAGKQLFRFDGVWLATMMKNFKSDVNYGVTLIPGTKANPNLRGSSRFETNSLAIPVVAAEKDGAWDLIKYLTNSEGNKKLIMCMGNLPARPALYEDKDVLAIADFPAFIDALKTGNGIQYPQIADLAKYTSLIDEHLDYVYNGKMTPEDAMNALKQQASALK